MSRKLLVFIMTLFISYLIDSKEYTFFYFSKVSGFDYYTGKDLSFTSNDFVVNDLKLLDTLEIEIKSNLPVRKVINKYENGKIKSIYSKNRDGRNTTYNYLQNGYVDSFDYEKRQYQEDNKCLLFEDDRLIFKITIEKDDNNYKKIIYEKPIKNSEKFYISEIFEYYYIDKSIQKYIETYYNQKGDIYIYKRHNFIYEDDKIISHTLHDKNDKLIQSYDYIYNEKRQLIEIFLNNYKFPSKNKKIIYEKFDLHNNWIKSKEYYNGELIYEVNRIIKYKY